MTPSCSDAGLGPDNAACARMPHECRAPAAAIWAAACMGLTAQAVSLWLPEQAAMSGGRKGMELARAPQGV